MTSRWALHVDVVPEDLPRKERDAGTDPAAFSATTVLGLQRLSARLAKVPPASHSQLISLSFTAHLRPCLGFSARLATFFPTPHSQLISFPALSFTADLCPCPA